MWRWSYYGPTLYTRGEVLSLISCEGESFVTVIAIWLRSVITREVKDWSIRRLLAPHITRRKQQISTLYRLVEVLPWAQQRAEIFLVPQAGKSMNRYYIDFRHAHPCGSLMIWETHHERTSARSQPRLLCLWGNLSAARSDHSWYVPGLRHHHLLM